MLRTKAITCLVFFLFSTASAFASIHECDGEVTDVAILTSAGCNHYENEQNHEQEHACCHHAGTEDDSQNCKSKNDCCQTSLISSGQHYLEKEQDELIHSDLVELPSFETFAFFATEWSSMNGEVYFEPPFQVKKHLAVLQVFRI